MWKFNGNIGHFAVPRQGSTSGSLHQQPSTKIEVTILPNKKAADLKNCERKRNNNNNNNNNNTNNNNCKGKGKDHPRTGHEGSEWE